MNLFSFLTSIWPALAISIQPAVRDDCIVIEQYPFDGMVNGSTIVTRPLPIVRRPAKYYDLDDKATVLAEAIDEILEVTVGSDKEDFLARHYIPMNATADGGKGGPGTDWTAVMDARNLNIPSRRHVGKHTFVNFLGRSPAWAYTESCVHIREIVQTTERFHVWELNYHKDEEKWVELFCAYTPIKVALDETGAPVHMDGPVTDPSQQQPCQ